MKVMGDADRLAIRAPESTKRQSRLLSADNILVARRSRAAIRRKYPSSRIHGTSHQYSSSFGALLKSKPKKTRAGTESSSAEAGSDLDGSRIRETEGDALIDN